MSLWRYRYAVFLLTIYGLSAFLFFHLFEYAPARSWSIPGRYASARQLSQDRQTLLISSHDWIQVWDVSLAQKKWEHVFEKAEVYPLFVAETISPDGRLVSYRRMYRAMSKDEQKTYVIDIATGKEVHEYSSKNDPWWNYPLRFTADSKTIIYPEQDKGFVIWDIASRTARGQIANSIESQFDFSVSCLGQHASRGEIFAVVNARTNQVELWNAAMGQKWKSIPFFKEADLQSIDHLWFSVDGKYLYLAGSHSREEQLENTFQAANVLCQMMGNSGCSCGTVMQHLLPVEHDYRLQFAFSRAQTHDTLVVCLDVEREQIRYVEYLPYAAETSSNRYLLRRSGLTQESMVDVYDVERRRLLGQVPVEGMSVQVDLLRRGDASNHFSISVYPQNNTIEVEHSGWKQPERWERVRDWLGQWIPALVDKSVGTIEHDNDATIYDLHSCQLIARFKQRRLNCFSPDGRAVATSSSQGDGTVIEVWDWPLRRPWLRILGWPVVVIVAIVLIRWVFGLWAMQHRNRRLRG